MSLPHSTPSEKPVQTLVQRGLEATRFALVGAVNTTVDVALFSLLFYVFGWPLLVANAGAFVVAVMVSFLLNKTWTFRDQSRGARAARRALSFVAVAVIGLGIASVTIWLAALVVPPIFAKLAAVGATFLWNYTASRRFVFRPHEAAR